MKLVLAGCKQSSCWMVTTLGATKVCLLVKLCARSAFLEVVLLPSVQSGRALRVLKLGDRWQIAAPLPICVSASPLAWIPAVTASR